MKLKTERIATLLNDIETIIEALKKAERKKKPLIAQVTDTYRHSARNLIHYKALRKFDLRKIQKELEQLGLSRLARAEGHVLASLLQIRYVLQRLANPNEARHKKPKLSIKSGKKKLATHTRALLGYRSKGRRVRIMVTQPTEAAHNYELVHNMVKRGMNCARVNCAHDDAAVWQKIISNVKRAAAAEGRQVQITMDLAGPKIRTGAIVPGARVRKFTPERNEMGHVISPALIVLVPALTEESEPNTLPVSGEWMQQLAVGDKLRVKDTRDKDRTLKVIQVTEHEVLVNCYDTSYLGTGTVLVPQKAGSQPCPVGQLPPIQQSILLRTNDRITIHKDPTPGEPARFDEDGNLLQQAHISCQLPEVFAAVKAGEAILFDDGKIEGRIESVAPESFEVLITRAKATGDKLKAEKGMNFPTTDIGISGLTAKDRQDMQFVARHADVVNFSFVNSAQDVEELLELFESLGATNKLSIILKIETRRAFDNLTEILLTAMKVHYVGVMIARGDLAIETGWDNIGWVQQEVLAMCNAAHIPVVWATQVLENMAKKGLPSRSEITDATTSLKAECVMLNKGLFIGRAIGFLDHILTNMEQYQDKNKAMLPQLEKLLPG